MIFRNYDIPFCEAHTGQGHIGSSLRTISDSVQFVASAIKSQRLSQTNAWSPSHRHKSHRFVGDKYCVSLIGITK